MDTSTITGIRSFCLGGFLGARGYFTPHTNTHSLLISELVLNLIGQEVEWAVGIPQQLRCLSHWYASYSIPLSHKKWAFWFKIVKIWSIFVQKIAIAHRWKAYYTTVTIIWRLEVVKRDKRLENNLRYNTNVKLKRPLGQLCRTIRRNKYKKELVFCGTTINFK